LWRKKNIDKKIVHAVSHLIQKSIAYSFENNHNEISAYVKNHASEMSETVMRQHIDLYVNDFFP